MAVHLQQNAVHPIEKSLAVNRVLSARTELLQMQYLGSLDRWVVITFVDVTARRKLEEAPVARADICVGFRRWYYRVEPWE